MSVQTQSMHKSHSIAKFQINSRRRSLVYFIFQPCVLNLWRGWWVIDFQVPKRLSFAVVLYKSSSIFILGNRFSLFGSSIFLIILLLLYRSFHVFLTIAICIYLCFAGEVLFRFLLLVSSVIRLEYQTRQASCVKG